MTSTARHLWLLPSAFSMLLAGGFVSWLLFVDPAKGQAALMLAPILLGSGMLLGLVPQSQDKLLDAKTAWALIAMLAAAAGAYVLLWAFPLPFFAEDRNGAFAVAAVHFLVMCGYNFTRMHKLSARTPTAAKRSNSV